MKYKCGDKHPTENLFFYKIVRGEPYWLTAEKLEHYRKKHAEGAKRRYRNTPNKEPKLTLKRGTKDEKTGLIFYGCYVSGNPYWITEEKYAQFKERIKNSKKRCRYHQERYKRDPVFKLLKLMRSRLGYIFSNPQNSFSKAKKTFEYVGCSPEYLKVYIENQFTEGMSWDNYGEWHVDHAIPFFKAKTEEELLELCHYTNLQPLWGKDNLCKGKLTMDEWAAKKEKFKNTENPNQ